MTVSGWVLFRHPDACSGLGVVSTPRPVSPWVLFRHPGAWTYGPLFRRSVLERVWGPAITVSIEWRQRQPFFACSLYTVHRSWRSNPPYTVVKRWFLPDTAKSTGAGKGIAGDCL